MTLTQLEYFIALAETLNFSRVARDFFVAQTSVSYAIQSLETEVGVKLFERTTKSTRLTAAGELFYEKIRPAVDLIHRATETAAAASENSTLMIGCSRLCSGKRFYDAVSTLQESMPETTLLLTAGEPEIDLLDELASGKVDIAVYLTNPYSVHPQHGQYVTHKFPINVPRRIIISKTHPYAQHREGLPPECIKSCRRITYGNLEDILLKTPSADEAAQRPLIAKDFYSLVDMVSSNLGVACLPIVSDLETEAVVTIPCLEEKAPEQFVSLAFTYEQNNPSPHVARAAERLEQLYRQTL